MVKPVAVGERPTLGARVRAFFAAWLTLIVSTVAGWLVFGALLEVLAFAVLRRGGNDGDMDHPLVLSVGWAFGAATAALVAGPPIVLLRRHIVRPDLPFVRPGYLGVAAVPFVLFGLAWGSEAGWYWLPLYAQVPLLLSVLVYIALARMFGLFAADRRSDPPYSACEPSVSC